MEKHELISDFVRLSMDLSVADFIHQMNWKEDDELCIRLFFGHPTEDDEKYINRKLRGLDGYRDRRSPIEYARELVFGWINEDCVIHLFNDCGINCRASGSDRRREFLSDGEITAHSDLEVPFDNGKSVKIELVTDYTSYWKRNRVMDLRHQKYPKMKVESSHILGIDFVNQEFLFFFVHNTDFECKDHHPIWNKPYTEVMLDADIPFRKMKRFKSHMKDAFGIRKKSKKKPKKTNGKKRISHEGMITIHKWF